MTELEWIDWRVDGWMSWALLGIGLLWTVVVLWGAAVKREPDEPGTVVVPSHPDCAACQLRAARRRRDGGVLAVLAIVAGVFVAVLAVVSVTDAR